MAAIVRALYDFDSADDSSLKFKKGDVIEVITRLDSGWWDGLCNGIRGWFPSEFVVPLEAEEVEHDEQGNEQEYFNQVDPSTNRKLSHTYSVEESYGNEINLPENWITHSAEDGTFWYYNSVTKETRWSYPGTPSQSDAHPTQGENGTSMLQDKNSSGVEVPSFRKAARSASDDKLPPNWKEKKSPNGRTYYFNMVTDDTTWNLNEVDWETGLIFNQNKASTKRNSAVSTSSGSSLGNDNPSIGAGGPPSYPKNRRPSGFVGPMDSEGSILHFNWARLTANIVLAIHRLNHSSKRNMKGYFIEQASAIVEAVRVMFVSSRTESMDSPVLNAHPMLKAHHHHVFNSLCRLVLSAQYASIVWCAPDAVYKMQQDANEVLLATRHFITVAQDNGVDIRSIDRAEPEGGETGRYDEGDLAEADPNSEFILDKSGAHTDILTELLACSGSVARSTNQLIKYLIMGDFKSASLVAFMKQAIAEIGQLLALTDDMDVENVDETIVRDFKICKQYVYNNIAILVAITQRATENLAPENISEQLLECARQVELSVKELIIASKFVIHEKEMYEQVFLAEKYRNHTNPNTPENTFRPRRAMSLSFLGRHVDRAYGLGADGENSAVPIRRRMDSHANITDSMDILHEEEPELPTNNKQKEKLKKFFGDDAPNTVVTKSASDERPWYLEYDYAPSDVVFNMEGQVKGGTLVALVERLTLHDLLDSTFIATFLLTYRSFTTTEDLFELLFERFNIQPPAELTNEEHEIWTEKKLVPIRLRVFNIMKSWLESYYLEGEDDFALEVLKNFAQDKMQEVMQFASNQLIKLIEKRMSSEGNFRKMVLNMSREAPLPILPRNMKKLKLLEIDPIEIARQFTIMDSTMYNKIRPVECLSKAWSQKDASIAVNIKAMIEVSNQVTNWVAETILSEKEVRKRVALIKHFISIGERCRSLNNFNTLTAILAGLNSAPIHRLKRTWELVNAKSIGTLDGLKKLMNSTKNFGEYREELHSVNPPCVPFLGLYLTDLTFVEDGNPDHVPNHPHLINIAKRAKCAEVIREIQQYQNSPYNLTTVPELQAFIWQALREPNGERDLYNMSLHMEPKEREDEKIARLLHESGFL
ncbi:ras GEF [Basidiobolus meristosporus CBS 931.73]|uniref:Ras GEF n=1 Tax=Basidiobolus meristosporus CBS 931.73 TaxID=1314790 RepID=A0A1Y1Z064_9FUNG|nr:ras GEF [Basidiobolus meristosporus CBS 931.73]|eukprot:ORY03599.1 ras GEF [Basidiobolus meristosporus CBS 931.73]